jgi:hypothetical protein
MSNNETLTWYAGVFKNWQVKACGHKPTAEMLEQVHLLGLRPGKQALANAMCLRPEGVSNPQIIAACGNPQLNRMRGLISDGLFKRHPAPMNPQGHTVYKCTITPKGEKRIETARKAAAELAAKGEVTETAKPKAKPAKAAKRASKPTGKVKTVEATKVAPAEKPVSEPATASQLPTPSLISDDVAAMQSPTL